MQETPVQILSREDPDRLPTPVFMSFPGGSDGKESTFNVGNLGLIPRLGRSPGGWAWQPTPVFLFGGSHGQRSLVGYSPWGFKELDMTERRSTGQYRITHGAYKHSQDRVREMKCHISYDACLRLRLI